MDFIQTHFDLVDKVRSQNFYPHLLGEDLHMPSLKQMRCYWFDFWNDLPDSPSIQTPLFHEICDFMDELSLELW